MSFSQQNKRLNEEHEYRYAFLTDPLYYGGDGIIAQSPEVISVINASLRKEFVFGPLHLDNLLAP